MQAVGYFDEDYTNVVAHHEQQFFEGFGLQRGTVAKHTTRYFGHTLNDIGNFLSEQVAKVFVRIVSILLHIVQQCGAD